MTVKSVSAELREPVKAELAALWSEREALLLDAVYQFYSSQLMI